jgi:hypothetical protein
MTPGESKSIFAACPTNWRTRNDLNHNSIPNDPRRSRRGVACRLDNLGRLGVKHFARFILWFLYRDQITARSTGRGPQYVAALNDMIAEWELILWNAEHPLHLGDTK